jgi:hypothetical protein
VARTGVTTSLTELREAVRQKATGSSLRQTATDIGMSWSGLRTFLNGTIPHPATVKKISDWYLRQSIGTQEDDQIAVELALNVLAERVAPAQRRLLKRAILDTVAKFTDREQATLPKRKTK